MMRIRALLTASVLAVGLAAHAQAVTLLDFSFTFTNHTFHGGGTVTGIVRGLTDNATSAASSVEVTGNTAGFGLGEYIGSPNVNLFTVVGATMKKVNFVSFGNNNSPPAVTCCSILMEFSANDFAALANDPHTLTAFRSPDLSFALIPAVPLPATLPLMVAALAGLAGIGLRRRAGPRSARRTSEG